MKNAHLSLCSSTVNVTCSIDAADGKPIFHIDYNSTSYDKVRVVEKYEPMINDMKYYFRGSILEQIIVYDGADIACTVSDARGQYTNVTHISKTGKIFSQHDGINGKCVSGV